MTAENDWAAPIWTQHSKFREKTDLDFSEGSEAKSPSNVASFSPVLFLIIITINHNIAFFIWSLLL